MARRKTHEDHVNHEAWAIPYGDLVTLLFALFTVSYAMSSVNEGNFRVLSDSMIAAFNGVPKSLRPLNIGEHEVGKGGDKPLVGITPTALMKVNDHGHNSLVPRNPTKTGGEQSAGLPGALIPIQRQLQDSIESLIDAKHLTVLRE